MAARYFRAIDGLGRIVLPAELLHHLNWEKGKMSVSIEEKDGSLIVFRPGCRPNPIASFPCQSPGQPGQTIKNHFAAGV